jgi:prepilin-type processing-associated H-X9-DG protein
MCPSRGRPNPQQVSSPDAFGWSYNAQTSTGTLLNPWGKTDYAGNYLMMPNITDVRFMTTGLRPFGGARNYPIANPNDIADGAANTIIVGEKAMPGAYYNTGAWYWDEPIFAGGSGGTSRGVPSAAPSTLNIDPLLPFYSSAQGFAPGSVAFNYPSVVVADSAASRGSFENNWGSAHMGGANFLFADGSVRTFNFNVDPVLFQGLLTPAGFDRTPVEIQQ